MPDPRRAKLLADISAVDRLIRDAFFGVTLEDGVGLLQGQEIDAYADAKTQLAARDHDKKQDWTRIPADLLNAAHSSLSFSDPKGMRFHLPAYLIVDLTGKLQQDIVFHLTYTDHIARTCFSALTADQRHAVHQFLLVHLAMIAEHNYEFEHSSVEPAIAEYWSR